MTDLISNIPKRLKYMATNTAQDAVRCSLCTEVVVFLCGSCHVNLCGQCLPTHLDRNKSLKHEILSYTSESVQPKPQVPECQDHPGESRKLYCQDCNVPICSQCLIMTGNHNRHGAVKLADFWGKNPEHNHRRFDRIASF